jgi:hypothetical protein
LDLDRNNMAPKACAAAGIHRSYGLFVRREAGDVLADDQRVDFIAPLLAVTLNGTCRHDER